MNAPVYRPSSFLATKGLFPEPTYRAFQRWDLSVTLGENVRHMRSANTVGGPSLGWLKDFGKVLLRRFGPAGPEPILMELAQKGCDLSVWKPLLLWHSAKTDPLLDAFLADWLFGEHQRGVVRLTTAAAESFLQRYLATAGHAWSSANVNISAGGLLRTASVFGLITAGRLRGFAPYRLPETCFLYCAHDLMQRLGSTAKVVAAREWRLFLMPEAAVEAELLRLHQLHLVHFARAGSLAELRLPCARAEDYARRMIA